MNCPLLTIDDDYFTFRQCDVKNAKNWSLRKENNLCKNLNAIIIFMLKLNLIYDEIKSLYRSNDKVSDRNKNYFGFWVERWKRMCIF